VKTTGVEELKAALRRSAWLIVGLTVFGAVIMTVIKQVDGPRYLATSKVVLSGTDLAANLTGIQQPYVDPTRQDQAEQNLAGSSPLYIQAAKESGGRFGSSGAMQSATSVGGGNNILAFSATTKNRDTSVGIANAVAQTYPSWRANVYGAAIQTAIRQLRAQLKATTSPSNRSALLAQLERLNVLKTLNSGNTLLVEPATDAFKTTPRPKRDAVLGAAIGLVVALLLTGVRELLDTRVRSESDVEDSLGVPVLATINTMPKRTRSHVIAASETRFSDTYELLAANVAQLLEEHPSPTHLAVTSAEPGEGKTTTAANLAAALARRGANVVVADFDLRKPAISQFFAIPDSAAGVTEVLKGVVGVRSTLWRIPLNGDGSGRPETAVEVTTAPARRAPKAQDATGSVNGSLVVLPAGRVGSNSSGTQYSRLPKILATLKPVADYIVIDTPPALLTSGVADLSDSVDAVLVVARQGSVTRRRLRSLGRQTAPWRSKLVGAVLNDASREEGYYSRYYYGNA
jgi:succinoglycan biosynthesis transport protein ExoP